MNATNSFARRCPARRLASAPPQRLLSSSRQCWRQQQQQPPVSAAEAAARLLEAHGHSDAVVRRRQLIDANQLAKLALTLGRTSVGGVSLAQDASSEAPASALPAGTPVPPGYHLVYFTPDGVEADLGLDGTDRSFNAPAPFSRRMWAGGAMAWRVAPLGREGLRVGDEVEERTRLVSATPKTSRNGSEMVLVEVDKELWSPRGLAVVDRRSWIFRPAVGASSGPPTALPTLPALPAPPAHTTIQDETDASGALTRSFVWSPVGLFRFSALTFNGHMIHYNEDWARRVESHPGLVVHGPLNLINLLDYWQDAHGSRLGRPVRRIAYRAVAPLYAGEAYRVRTKATRKTEGSPDPKEPVWDVVAEKDGKPCMVAEIV